MVETIQVGQKAPEFELETFNPQTGDFDSVKKFWDVFPRKECAAAHK